MSADNKLNKTVGAGPAWEPGVVFGPIYFVLPRLGREAS